MSYMDEYIGKGLDSIELENELMKLINEYDKINIVIFVS